MLLWGAFGAENLAKGAAAIPVINIATIDPKITLDDPSEHYFHLHLEGDGGFEGAAPNARKFESSRR